MSWVYVERESFIRMCEKANVSSEVREAIKIWAPTVSNKYETPRSKLIFRSISNRHEAWSAGIPNPDSNRGKSGGFRVVYFLDTMERTISLDHIEIRKEMGYKNEGKKKKDAYNDYVREVKKFLSKMDSSGT